MELRINEEMFWDEIEVRNIFKNWVEIVAICQRMELKNNSINIGIQKKMMTRAP